MKRPTKRKMTEAMEFMRRSFTVLGTIVFAVLVLAALAPKAARGVATAYFRDTCTSRRSCPAGRHARSVWP